VSIRESRKRGDETPPPTVPKSRRTRRRSVVEAAMLHGHPSKVKATKIPRRTFLHLAAGAAAVPAMSPKAGAQTYPTRPIRMLIPYPPGGSADAVGRPLADKIKPLLGTVVIENVGGAGGVLGAASVARAKPDGYTILLGGTTTQVLIPILSNHPSYDPIKDFDPIALLCAGHVAIVSTPSLPVQTLKDLVDYAGNNPSKLSYGSTGIGTGNHLVGEQFKTLTGLNDITHVPYRGAAPLISDVISGQIPIGIATLSEQIIELHATGRLRMLALTTKTRVAAASSIPTVAEAGFPSLGYLSATS
jgi:tripartite-type tricarboxylate transporter receptor subunit TctC